MNIFSSVIVVEVSDILQTWFDRSKPASTINPSLLTSLKGTVDLVTYEILQTEPLKFSEKSIGTGAKCGSTAIDRNFFEWAELNFGEAYTELNPKKKGPGSTFMESFEAAKRRFGDSDDAQSYFEIAEIDMELTKTSPLYDEDEQCVKIPR